jgi:hypothetical protein
MLAYLRTNDLRPNICHRAEVLHQFALLPFNGACRIGPCFHDSFTTVSLHLKALSISVLLNVRNVLCALRLVLAMVLHNGRRCFIPFKTRVVLFTYCVSSTATIRLYLLRFWASQGGCYSFGVTILVTIGAHATTDFSLKPKCELQLVSLCFNEHKKSTWGLMGCVGSTFHMITCASHTSSRRTPFTVHVARFAWAATRAAGRCIWCLLFTATGVRLC